MIWVERVEWTFARAPWRRQHVRGKWADRRAHLEHVYRTALDEIYSDMFRAEHPFLRSP